LAEGSYRKKEIFLAQHTMKNFESWGKIRGRRTVNGVGEEVNNKKLHDLEFLADVLFP
jgi:hypothetical protein